MAFIRVSEEILYIVLVLVQIIIHSTRYIFITTLQFTYIFSKLFVFIVSLLPVFSRMQLVLELNFEKLQRTPTWILKKCFEPTRKSKLCETSLLMLNIGTFDRPRVPCALCVVRPFVEYSTSSSERETILNSIASCEHEYFERVDQQSPMHWSRRHKTN